MKLPVQAQPIVSKVSTAKIISPGIAPLINCSHCNGPCLHSPEACEACIESCHGI
jgi:hypothetical protein